MSHNMKFRNSILLLTLPLFSACSPTEMVTSIFDNHGGSWFGVVIGIVLLIIAIGLTIDSFSSGNVEDGFARFFGITLLIAGGIALVAAGPWGGSNDNPDNEETEATGHYSTSYDDDHGSSTKSSSSSSSSGTSSGGSVWDQPQPQSWGGGYSQQNSPSNERPLKMVRVWHECGYCNGTGREARTTYCPGAEGKKYCPECGGTFWAFEGHYHTRCSSCNGQKGYYTESWE